MKRLIGALFLFAALAVPAAAGAYTADFNPTSCGGAQIVNVTYEMINDYDSNTHGGAWANDTITRHLQLFDLGGSFCATVNDTGSFVTMDADSPNGTGTVTAGITGQINGGYLASITGTLSDSPDYKTHGFLGTFDLQCEDAYNCPGDRPSFLSYLDSGATYTLDDWGWYYHTPQNGDWLNDAGGNVGDITG